MISKIIVLIAVLLVSSFAAQAQYLCTFEDADSGNIIDGPYTSEEDVSEREEGDDSLISCVPDPNYVEPEPVEPDPIEEVVDSSLSDEPVDLDPAEREDSSVSQKADNINVQEQSKNSNTKSKKSTTQDEPPKEPSVSSPHEEATTDTSHSSAQSSASSSSSSSSAYLAGSTVVEYSDESVPTDTNTICSNPGDPEYGIYCVLIAGPGPISDEGTSFVESNYERTSVVDICSNPGLPEYGIYCTRSPTPPIEEEPEEEPFEEPVTTITYPDDLESRPLEVDDPIFIDPGESPEPQESIIIDLDDLQDPQEPIDISSDEPIVIVIPTSASAAEESSSFVGEVVDFIVQPFVAIFHPDSSESIEPLTVLVLDDMESNNGLVILTI